MIWDTGDMYEGEFRRGEWSNGTIGKFTFADGTVLEGRWEAGDLADGVATYLDGTRQRLTKGSAETSPVGGSR